MRRLGHEGAVAPDLLALVDEVQALLGVAVGRLPVADELLEHGHRLDERRQQPDLPELAQPPVLRLVQGQRRREPAGVVQAPLGHFLGPPGDERVAPAGQEPDGPVDVVEGQPLAPGQPEVRPLQERAGEVVRVGVDVGRSRISRAATALRA